MGHHFALEDMVPHRSRASDARLLRTYMPCCHPLKAFDTGCLTDNGKPDYVVCPNTAGDLLNVKVVERKGKRVSASAPLVRVGNNTFIKNPIAIPCGHCVGCRMDKAKRWKTRVCHEMELYKDRCHFVTLTYDDRHLPTYHGQLSLCRKDVQDFLNRLRNPEYGVHKQFRYFLCGEYGTAQNGTHRPHYHVILFGDLDDLVPYRYKHFHSETIAAAWKNGLHDVEPVYPETVAYVAGYVEKKQNDPFFDDYPIKPFLMMSTKPAIGSHYVERLKGTPDRKVYGDFGKQRSASIPRAYLKKCEEKDWYPAFKEDSLIIAQRTLRTNLAACNTRDQEKLGNIQEAAQEMRLKKLRKDVL